MIEQALQETASLLDGHELVVCILSHEQWLLKIDIQAADMLVEETRSCMEVAVHLLRTNHLLITITSNLVTNDFAEETLKIFLALLGLTQIQELERLDERT